MEHPLLTTDTPTNPTTKPLTPCLSMACMGQWFTPNRAVFCLTSVCALNYLDRGIISGAALEIKGCARSWSQCDLRPGQNSSSLHQCLYDCKKCTCPSETQTGFGINSQQLGYLQAAFMIGYSMSSMVYSKLVHTVRPFKIISIALWLWIVAVILSGVSGLWCTQQQQQQAMHAAGEQGGLCSAFYLAVFARALSGVGEAATATIAVVYLDDTLPPGRKGLLFAVYFSAIPVGTALGFIYAGQVAAHGKWEWAFIGEAPLMVIFAIGSYFVPFRLKKKENLQNKTRGMGRPPSLEHISGSLLAYDANVEYEQQQRRRTGTLESIGSNLNTSFESAGSGAEVGNGAGMPPTIGSERLADFQLDAPGPPPTMLSELAACVLSPVYMLTAFGYASFTAVVAGFSFYGPMYIRERKEWGYTEGQADLVFGGIVAFTGLVGTAMGGLLLDKGSGAAEGSERLVPALGQVFVEVTIGAAMCVLAGYCDTAVAFFACLALGVFVMFMTTAGVNVALMWSVPPKNRAMAMALSVILIHLLGDVPSPVVIGAIDRSNTPRTTFLATASWLVWAVFCWGAAWTVAKIRVRRERAASSSDAAGELDGGLVVGGRLETIQASPQMGYAYDHPETEDDTEDELSPPWQDWRQREVPTATSEDF